MAHADLLIRNVHLATMAPGGVPYGAVRDAALVVRDRRIAWMGPETGLRPEHAPEAVEVDGEGRWVTPGLVDCHTHLVFGGNRAADFERRLGGATYEDIAREGGGILSTVRATRSASFDELVAAGAGRLAHLAQRGVTTVEIKSGYGLTLDAEVRMLLAAREAGERTGVRVRTTLLGAHALPPEYADRRDAYVTLVADVMVPEAARLGVADAVDAFCEGIAFSPQECARVFDAAQRVNLPVRLHADQLSDLGGAALAARYGARSADHLEHASEEGVGAMAAAGTVAVLLPGAAHFLRDPRVPPVDAFRRHGVPMAVATDLNPGSSPLLDPLGALSLACVLFRLTPEEALAGMTRVGAAVLGLEGEVGVIAPHAAADLVLWSVDHPAELAYWMGGSPAWRVIRAGEIVPPAQTPDR